MTKEDYFEQAVNAFGDDKLDEAIQAGNHGVLCLRRNGYSDAHKDEPRNRREHHDV